MNVDWEQSQDYCEWRQAFLPTEAQWEKSARGDDGRIYSWGIDLSCERANYTGCAKYIVAVGNYESGKSPYGAYDMIGNVEEWVADWYSATYYAISPIENPEGPINGDYKVFRGGGYFSYVNSSITTYDRSGAFPNRYYERLGFRCAKDAP